MATMHFIPELQKFLIDRGFIYTARKYLYRPSEDTVFIPGVGGCHRELVKGGVGKEDLIPYSGYSGFKTLEDWWNKIVELNRGLPSRLNLYYISIIRRSNDG